MNKSKYKCECGKNYVTKKGYTNHKKKCDGLTKKAAKVTIDDRMAVYNNLWFEVQDGDDRGELKKSLLSGETLVDGLKEAKAKIKDSEAKAAVKRYIDRLSN